MDQALKDAIRAHLRPVGWTGRLPHLRRRSPDQICLLSFQYLSSGGSFVAEIAECDREGYVTSWGKHISPDKVAAKDVNDPRPRLGNPIFPHGDHWFMFGPRNYEAEADVVHPREHYALVAGDVMRLVDEQAERWWRDQLQTREAAAVNGSPDTP